MIPIPNPIALPRDPVDELHEKYFNAETDEETELYCREIVKILYDDKRIEEYPDVVVDLGASLSKTRKGREEGKKIFKHLYTVAPADYLKVQLAKMYFYSGDYMTASDILSKYSTCDKCGECNFMYGTIAESRGEFADAFKYYDAAWHYTDHMPSLERIVAMHTYTEMFGNNLAEWNVSYIVYQCNELHSNGMTRTANKFLKKYGIDLTFTSSSTDIMTPV